VLDAELQQRACEYLALVQRGRIDDDELLQVVLEEMPPFPARESALLNRLHKKGRDTEDKRTWNLDGRAEKRSDAPPPTHRQSSNGDEVSAPAAPAAMRSPPLAVVEPPLAPLHPVQAPYAAPQREDSNDLTMMGVAPSSYGAGSIMDSLAGLDLSSNAVQEERLLPSSPAAASPSAAVGLGGATSPVSAFPAALLGGAALTPALTAGANIDKWFDRLSYTGEGVLYEDAQLQIGVKTEFHGALGRVQLYIGNKLPVPLANFALAVESASPDAIVATLAGQLAGGAIAPLTQVQQQIQVECKECFASPPVVRISYIASSTQTLALRLPVTITSFIEPVKLPAAVFFERWKLIGGPPRESQTILCGAVDRPICAPPLLTACPPPSRVVPARSSWTLPERQTWPRTPRSSPATTSVFWKACVVAIPLPFPFLRAVIRHRRRPADPVTAPSDRPQPG
jgi:AP-2 complex subunit alpha